MLPEPVAPHPLLMFGLAFVAVVAVLLLIWVLAQLTRLGQRLSDPETQRRVVAAGGRIVRGAANSVQARSARPNAEKTEVQGVPTVAKGSDLNPKAEPRSASSDLPATVEELQKLGLILVLYGRRPNKEAAIQDATGATKGAGSEYQRWSALFDLAAPADGQARAAAKATKPAAPPASSTSGAPSAPVRSAATGAPARPAAEPAT